MVPARVCGTISSPRSIAGDESLLIHKRLQKRLIRVGQSGAHSSMSPLGRERISNWIQEDAIESGTTPPSRPLAGRLALGLRSVREKRLYSFVRAVT
jgi:hypothetical protein